MIVTECLRINEEAGWIYVDLELSYYWNWRAYVVFNLLNGFICTEIREDEW